MKRWPILAYATSVALTLVWLTVVNRAAYSDNGAPNPDAFGYSSSGTLVAPVDANAPAFNIEPNVTAPVVLALGDDTFSDQAIAFPFTFYGVAAPTVRVASNGYIAFTLAGGGDFTETCPLPTALDEGNLFAAIWDDFSPNIAGTVTVSTEGVAPCRRFLVSFAGVPHFAAAGLLNTFQIKLLEAGNTLEAHYGAISDDGGSFAIGIENVPETIGVNYRCGTYAAVGPPAGTAVRFFLPGGIAALAACVPPPPAPNPALADDDPDRNATLKGCFVDSVLPAGVPTVAFAILAVAGCALLMSWRQGRARSNSKVKRWQERALTLALLGLALGAVFHGVFLHELSDRGSDSAGVARQGESGKLEAIGMRVTADGLKVDYVVSSADGRKELRHALIPGAPPGERLEYVNPPDQPWEEIGFEWAREALATHAGDDAAGDAPADAGDEATAEQILATEQVEDLPQAERDALNEILPSNPTAGQLAALEAQMLEHRNGVIANLTQACGLTSQQANLLRAALEAHHAAYLQIFTNPQANYAQQLWDVKRQGNAIYRDFRPNLTAEQRIPYDLRTGTSD